MSLCLPNCEQKQTYAYLVLNYCTQDYLKSWHHRFSEKNHLQVHSLLPNLQCDDCLGRSLKYEFCCCARLLRINTSFSVFLMSLLYHVFLALFLLALALNSETYWFAGVEIAQKAVGWYKIYVCTYVTGQVMDLVLKGKKNTVVLHPGEQMHSLVPRKCQEKISAATPK